MKYTQNYKFKKPDLQDVRNIKDINDTTDLIDATLKKVEDENKRIDTDNKSLNATFNNLLINAGNSNAEIVDMRTDKNGTNYPTAGDRLDAINSSLDDNAKYIDENAKLVTQYGFKNDGLTENSQFQSILLDALDNENVGVIKFPKGVYKFDNSLVFKNLKNVTIQGDGSILRKTNKSFLNQSLFRFENCENVVIEGITIEGISDYVTDGDDGIIAYGCKTVKINKCVFKNLGDAAVRVTGFNLNNDLINSYNFMFCNNYVENCRQTSTSFTGAKSIVFTDNIFHNIWGSVKFGTRIPSEFLIIANNILYNDTLNVSTIGISVSNYSNFTVKNNTIKNAGKGISIYFNSVDSTQKKIAENINLSDNIIDGFSTNAIEIQNLGENNYNGINGLIVESNQMTQGNQLNAEDIDPNVPISNGLYIGALFVENLIVKNNIFKNLKSCGITLISGNYDTNSYTKNINISNNSFSHMTKFCILIKQRSVLSIKNAIISDNIAIDNINDFIKFTNHTTVTSPILEESIVKHNIATVFNTYMNGGKFLKCLIEGNKFKSLTLDSTSQPCIVNVDSCKIKNNEFTAENAKRCFAGNPSINCIYEKNNFIGDVVNIQISDFDIIITLPPAGSTYRGKVFTILSDNGDGTFICKKNLNGVYEWKQMDI